LVNDVTGAAAATDGNVASTATSRDTSAQ